MYGAKLEDYDYYEAVWDTSLIHSVCLGYDTPYFEVEDSDGNF